MRKWIVVLIFVLVAGGALAQEVTPAPEETQTSMGPVTFTLPAGWYAFPQQEGNGSLVSNTDLTQIEGGNYPDGMVIVNAALFTRAQVGSDIASETPTAVEVLTAVAAAQELNVEVIEAPFVGVDSAKALNPSADFEQEVYVTLVEQGVYSINGVVGVGETSLTDNAANIETILSTLAVNYEATLSDPLPDYSDIEQGVTADGFPRLGAADAPASLTEISSFSCPHCAEFHAVGFPAILERVREGSANFIYVPIYGFGSVGDGEQASRAGICALEQGKFWEMHDALFSWQQYGAFAFARPRLSAGAEALGLDVDAFTTCLDADATTERIASARAFSEATEGFQGTPTLILNERIINWFPLEGLNALIDEAASPVEATPEPTPGS